MSLLIKNAVIVNADGEKKASQDILIKGSTIEKIGKDLSADGVKVVDASGKKVLPGFIDLHCHLREPGQEHKETIETGCRAAVKGGFTSLFCMPNTRPPIDNGMIVEGVIKEARRVGLANVYPVGAISKGQNSQEMVDMYEMKAAGCLALSDDGKAVNNSQLMLLALRYADMVGLLLMEHCQDPLISGKGVMNEGLTASVLGMRGDPGVSETVIVGRDIELANYVQARIHLSHISLKRSCELIRFAKSQGVRVTAEACPHHFTLTDEAVKGFDPNTKVNPPLRTADDVEAIKAALADGTLDCVSTDHAPHTLEDKEEGFDHAPFGISGFETAFGLCVTHLVRTKVLTLAGLVDKMCQSPARIAGLKNKGRIEEGADADLVIVDTEAEWEVRKEDFVSKGKNSPFFGWKLHGLVEKTICGGKVVFER
ncbi:MAG TPA: dihydroorotase [Candidatus Omnitrophota bacterium]|nr:dihydroorotase [Candidatus Omnitrophota bacterium]HSA30647.1 dihydroorotase [Candidatus Omnitrophota bacterium]